MKLCFLLRSVCLFSLSGYESKESLFRHNGQSMNIFLFRLKCLPILLSSIGEFSCRVLSGTNSVTEKAFVITTKKHYMNIIQKNMCFYVCTIFYCFVYSFLLFFLNIFYALCFLNKWHSEWKEKEELHCTGKPVFNCAYDNWSGTAYLCQSLTVPLNSIKPHPISNKTYLNPFIWIFRLYPLIGTIHLKNNCFFSLEKRKCGLRPTLHQSFLAVCSAVFFVALLTNQPPNNKWTTN